MRFKVKARVWVYAGDGAWRFITVPQDISCRIKSMAPRPRRTFGSQRVAATIGKTTWKTSLFPSAKADAFLLPIKASVRRAENIADGDTVSAVLKIDF